MVGVHLGRGDVLRVLRGVVIPVDLELGHPASGKHVKRISTTSFSLLPASPGVGGQNVPLEFVHLRRLRVVLLQLRVHVVVTHVVTDPDELCTDEDEEQQVTTKILMILKNPIFFTSHMVTDLRIGSCM